MSWVSIDSNVPSSRRRASHETPVAVLAGLLLGAAIAIGGAALTGAAVGAGLVALVLAGRPAPTLAVIAATAGFAANLAVPAVGGATAIAVLCCVGRLPTIASVTNVVPRRAWLLLVLAGLFVASAVANGEFGGLRQYLTRLVILPVLLAVVATAALPTDRGFARTVAWPAWFGAVVGSVAALTLGVAGDGRLGFFGDFNRWSTFLIIAAAGSVALARGRLLRLALLLGPVFIALLQTDTRSSTAAALLAVLIAATGPNGFALERRVVMGLGTAAVVLGLVLSPAGSGLVDRLLARDVGTQRSTENRLLLTETSLRVTRANPIWGVGPGAFSAKLPALQLELNTPVILDRESQAVETHNFYTQVSSEIGVPALGVLLIILLGLLRLPVRPSEHWVKGAFIGVLATGLVQNIGSHLALPLSAGLLLAANRIYRDAGGRNAPHIRPPNLEHQ